MMLACLATPYVLEAMVPYRRERGQAGTEGAGEGRTNGDVRSVAVEILVGVGRNRLAPLGAALQLDVLDVDSARRAGRGLSGVNGWPTTTRTHVSIT